MGSWFPFNYRDIAGWKLGTCHSHVLEDLHMGEVSFLAEVRGDQGVNKRSQNPANALKQALVMCVGFCSLQSDY